MPRPEGYHGPETSYGYLQSLVKDYAHGERFIYKTVNTDVLAWVMSRVTGKPLVELVRERFWSKLGVEQDAYFTVDSIGTEFAGGGLNLTLRDLARFGEMIRLGGRFNGQQIVPTAAIDDLRRGGDRELFGPAGYKTLPGWSYHTMWWADDANPRSSSGGRLNPASSLLRFGYICASLFGLRDVESTAGGRGNAKQGFREFQAAPANDSRLRSDANDPEDAGSMDGRR